MPGRLVNLVRMKKDQNQKTVRKKNLIQVVTKNNRYQEDVLCCERSLALETRGVGMLKPDTMLVSWSLMNLPNVGRSASSQARAIMCSLKAHSGMQS